MDFTNRIAPYSPSVRSQRNKPGAPFNVKVIGNEPKFLIPRFRERRSGNWEINKFHVGFQVLITNQADRVIK
jgi:hypothetical protein